VTHTPIGEAVLFWVLAPICVIAALGMVGVRKAVHSALMLAVVMICLAMFFAVQSAPFLAVVQVVVYTGAVMMLFLFVLMVVGVDSSDSLVETLRGQRVGAVLAGSGFGIMVVAGFAHATVTDFEGLGAANSVGNVQAIGVLLFTRYVFVFEITGGLLITAALGAMVLTHRERIGPRRTQQERSVERFKGDGLVTPMPPPGVYARHNAVDTPALLPDGTPSELSISWVLRARGEVLRPPTATRGARGPLAELDGASAGATGNGPEA
jgi:NADH-quinone oxidoreductase subunit J